MRLSYPVSLLGSLVTFFCSLRTKYLVHGHSFYHYSYHTSKAFQYPLRWFFQYLCLKSFCPPSLQCVCLQLLTLKVAPYNLSLPITDVPLNFIYKHLFFPTMSYPSSTLGLKSQFQHSL